jgi:predicted RNA-binding Zn-ribbon protein involved in translation (DUF1610 family)
VGIVATAISVIAWTTIPAWPVIGVAVATLVVCVSTITQKLNKDLCYSCGATLTSAPMGEHGAICPTCGAIHRGYDGWLANLSQEARRLEARMHLEHFASPETGESEKASAESVDVQASAASADQRTHA